MKSLVKGTNIIHIGTLRIQELCAIDSAKRDKEEKFIEGKGRSLEKRGGSVP